MDSQSENGPAIPSRGQRLFACFTLLVTLITLCSAVIPVLATFSAGGYKKDRGWMARCESDKWFVTTVIPKGAADGALHSGDRLIAINGDRRASKTGPDVFLNQGQPDSTYQIVVERGGRERQFDLRLAKKQDLRSVYLNLGEFVEGLAFFCTGVLIALLRPSERMARLAFLSSFLTAIHIFYLASNVESGMLSQPLLTLATAQFCVAPFHWVTGFFFYAAFPAPLSASRGWRRFGNVLLVCGALLWFPLTLRKVISVLPPEAAISFGFRYPGFVRLLGILAPSGFTIFIIVSIVATLLVVRRNFVALPEGDLKRRIRWVAWGAAAGFAPILLRSLLHTGMRALGLDETYELQLFVISRVADFLTVIIPLTIAYAVIKHRVLGVGIAVRIGVQYLFAKNLLRIILLLPVAALTVIVARHTDATVRELLITSAAKTNLILLGITLMALRYRNELMLAIDRRFFRVTYRQEMILVELAESIRRLDSVTEIAGLLSSEIEQALHPESVYVFYRGERNRAFSLVQSTTGARGLSLPLETALPRVLEDQRTCITAREVVRLCPSEESEWLKGLGVQLVVPIQGTGMKLHGMLLLGEKRSEEPYTQKDRQLLDVVATQVGMVCENLSLKEQMRQDRQVQTHVLARLEEQQTNLVRECPQCGTCYDGAIEKCAKDQCELEMTIPMERVVDQKYRLERVIGRGGMGAAYQATDLRLARRVAVKVMLTSTFGDKEARRRFEREAHACARLDHPNIVRIYDFGELTGGGAYLVLEYVDGKSLDFHWSRFRAKPSAIAPAVAQMLDGVEAAHRSGIVHRDLNPKNVLLSEKHGELQVKILDFGLAKLRWPSPDANTVSGLQCGTYGYIAPEQFYGLPTDSRADIYSLGVITIEMLTGRLEFRQPFPDRDVATALQKRLAEFDQGWKRLAPILNRAVALKRDERYPDIAAFRNEVISALRQCADKADGRAEDTTAEIDLTDRRAMAEARKLADDLTATAVAGGFSGGFPLPDSKRRGWSD